jgi:hypothetical protein
MNTFWDNLGIKPTVDTGKIRKAYSALEKSIIRRMMRKPSGS